MPKHRLCLARVALLTVAVALGSARATWGESGIVLPYPSEFGSYKAHTYDEAGRRIADAELVIEQRARGIVYMYVRGGAMDGAAALLVDLCRWVWRPRGRRRNT